MQFDELLRENNVPIAPSSHEHARTGWVNFDCPFCGPNTQRFHMGYSVAYGSVNCWRCGRHRLAAVLTALLGISSGKARAAVGRLPRHHTAQERLTGALKVPKGLGPLQQSHKRYLKDRGFDPLQLEQLWDISGLSHKARPPLNHRIYIPIYRHGVQVSWQARATTDNTLRYLSAEKSDEAYPLRQWLYGADYARNAIIICEGVTDVWRVGPGAVATFGLAYSTAQLRLMLCYPVRVVCFDNEKAAQNRAKKLLDLLSLHPGQNSNAVLDAADPGSADMREVRALRKAFLE